VVRIPGSFSGGLQFEDLMLHIYRGTQPNLRNTTRKMKTDLHALFMDQRVDLFSVLTIRGVCILPKAQLRNSVWSHTDGGAKTCK